MILLLNGILLLTFWRQIYYAFQYLNGFLLDLIVSSLKKVSLKLGFIKAMKVISLKLLLASGDQQFSKVY